MSLSAVLTEGLLRGAGRVALVERERRASYGELAASSDGVAAVLVAAGVRRGDRVAIYSRKSIESVAAIYGALKAGAAYVPLDPLDPPERTRGKIADCAPNAVLCAPSLRGRLSPALRGTRARVLDLTARAENRSPVVRIRPGDPAYLLYTSGSTGRPKAVVVSHAAARNFVDWSVGRFRLSPRDALAACAPFHFDLSVFDLFGGAKAGARVVLVPEELWAFPRELASLVIREKVTVWYSAPSALVRLTAPGGLRPGSRHSLRAVLFAGEVFPPKHLRALAAAAPAAALYNLYGPTETNVCAMHRVSRVPADGGSVPIGRACAGSLLRVIDDDGRRVRNGGEGTLFAAGPGLMTGYWGRRATRKGGPRTRRMPGDRRARPWYDTGDRVRVTRNGTMTFLGRRDHLVKVRGHRVSLSEVEAALLRCPGVEEAVALVRPGADGATLAALVRSGPRGARVDHASRHLPIYMVPRPIIVSRDPLPRTSTGKIDRAAASRLVEGDE